MSRYIRVFAMVAILMIVAAGCGKKNNGSSSSTTSVVSPAGTNSSTTTAGSSTGSDALSVQNFSFTPSTINEKAGVAFTITNKAASTTHSFTLDDGSVSTDISAGTSKSVTLPDAGSFSFHCRFHSSMTGTVNVS